MQKVLMRCQAQPMQSNNAINNERPFAGVTQDGLPPTPREIGTSENTLFQYYLVLVRRFP
jgi:hypothetical protein